MVAFVLIKTSFLTVEWLLYYSHLTKPSFLTLFAFLGIFSSSFLHSDEIQSGSASLSGNLSGLETMKIQVGGLSDGVYQHTIAADSN